MRVALVDQGKIGGTCLHVGCIPTKALLESAEFFTRVKKAKDFGILIEGKPAFDYAAIAARRDQVVKRMWTGLQGSGRQEQGDLVRRPGPIRRPDHRS